MSIAPFLKEIGRGKDGARHLERAQACELMSAVLDGRASDLERGAFAIAMRIKGETAGELAGFLDALESGLMRMPQPMPASTRSDAAIVVALPSYNGARKLPNLTALLALSLARAGLRVLVHGPPAFAGRTTTAAVFDALGMQAATSAAAVQACWAEARPAYVPIEALHPPLARLLALRDVIGLRNSGHTLAKLLAPGIAGHTLRVVNHTHPEYATSLGELLTLTQADALLMRGTEGEPVADLRRRPRMAVFLGGQHDEALSLPAHEGVLATLPADIPGPDAAATARYIAAVLGGRQALPEPIAAQVALIRTLAGRVAARD
jgi:anthranilate phosphoribosyltransferase